MWKSFDPLPLLAARRNNQEIGTDDESDVTGKHDKDEHDLERMFADLNNLQNSSEVSGNSNQ